MSATPPVLYTRPTRHGAMAGKGTAKMCPGRRLAFCGAALAFVLGYFASASVAQQSSSRDRAFLTLQEGYVAHRQGDLVLAESKFRTVFDFPDPREEFPDVPATAGLGLATTLIQQGRKQEGVEMYSRLTSMPNAPEEVKAAARQGLQK